MSFSPISVEREFRARVWRIAITSITKLHGQTNYYSGKHYSDTMARLGL